MDKEIIAYSVYETGGYWCVSVAMNVKVITIKFLDMESAHNFVVSLGSAWADVRDLSQ